MANVDFGTSKSSGPSCSLFSTLFGLTTLAIAQTAGAQETCGLQLAKYDQPDPIFRNGFENVTLPLAESAAQKSLQAKGAGLGPPLSTVMPPELGVTPTITITSPAVGAVINTESLQVEGVFTGPANTGITVLGQRSFVVGNRFISVPLRVQTSGAVDLSVSAKTLDNQISVVRRNINFGVPMSKFRITPTAIASFAPVRLRFGIELIANRTIQSIAVDFDGDGGDDFSGAASSIPDWNYVNPGIYTVRMNALMSDGTTSIERISIVALPLAETRANVCSAYAHLRSRLNANDSAGASLALTSMIRPQFLDLFAALGVNRPVLGANLGQLATGIFSPVSAEVISVLDFNGQLIGAPISFTSASDGVWRIDAL